MNTEIGVATMVYSEEGKILQASFIPTSQVDLGNDILNQLAEVKNTDEETIRENANLILGAWFEKQNSIELADRDEYEIVTEPVYSSKYPSGKVKTCIIKFTFKQLKNNG